MSFFPGNDPQPGDFTAVDSIETLIIPRTSDIGGLEVRRALPTAKRRLVGPFIFFARSSCASCGRSLSGKARKSVGMTTRSSSGVCSFFAKAQVPVAQSILAGRLALPR